MKDYAEWDWTKLAMPWLQDIYWLETHSFVLQLTVINVLLGKLCN